MESDSTNSLQYSTDAARGAGRTPIGIILSAVCHLLLGSLLVLLGYGLVHEAWLARQFDAEMVAGIVILIAAVPMLGAGITLLLKGKRAWITCVIFHVMLAIGESILAAWGFGSAAWRPQDNESSLIVGVVALLLLWMCLVVLSYLGKAKARACFALTPGEAPVLVRRLPLTLAGAAVLIVVWGVVIGSSLQR